MKKALQILREAAKYCHDRVPTIENIQKGVKLANEPCTKYTQGPDGYWTLTFADTSLGEIEVISLNPEEIAKEIMSYTKLARLMRR